MFARANSLPYGAGKPLLFRQTGQLIIVPRGAPLKALIPLSAPEIRHPSWDALFLFTLIFERDLRVGDVCGSKQFALRSRRTVTFQANWTIDNCPSGRAAKGANPSLCAKSVEISTDFLFCPRIDPNYDPTTPPVKSIPFFIHFSLKLPCNYWEKVL